MSRLALLPLLLAPTSAFASLTVLEFDCAPPLAIDLTSPTLFAGGPGFEIYEIPHVDWQGVEIQYVGVGEGPPANLTIGDGGFNHQISFDGPPGVGGGVPATLDLADWTSAVYRFGGLVQCPVAAISTVEPPDPVALAVEQMQVTANAWYPGADPVQDSGPARLRPARFASEIDGLITLLTDAGCVTDASDNVAGAFHPGPDGVLGERDDGSPIVATLRTRTRRLSGTMGGLGLGENAGVWDPTHRFVADYEGGGFVAGYAARVEGRRGVFMGVHAVCPAPISSEAVLAGWIDSSLAGLDPEPGSGPEDLVGSWSVHVDCASFGASDELWAVTDSGGGLFTVSGSGFVDTATQTSPTDYDTLGDVAGFSVVGALSQSSPDTFSGSASAVGTPIPIDCTFDGTRN